MKAKILEKANEIQREIDALETCIREMDYALNILGKKHLKAKLYSERICWSWQITNDDALDYARMKKREAETELAHEKALMELL